MINQRNTYIDILRFVGMSMVILAHVNTPDIIHQFRCFDVPLMVFISGLSYSGKSIPANFTHYYFHRVLRLTIPVYIFLTIYFVILAAIGKLPTITTIIGSFCLLESHSIGYVWIIKVFILIMIATPLLQAVTQRINRCYFWLLILFLLIFEEFICINIIQNIKQPILKLIFTETIPYIIGYSVPFILGLRLRNISAKEENITLVIILTLALVIFTLHCGLERSLSLQTFKYPPYPYFLLYGMLISSLLWKLRNIKFIKTFFNNNLILFIGRNTIWIYLWHIGFVYIANHYIHNWILRWLFVYFIALCCYYIQYKVVTKLKFKFNYRFLNYLLG